MVPERALDSLVIRRAQPSDLAAVTAIYNDAVLTTTATFDTQPKTLQEQEEWLAGHGGRFPVLVAVLDGEVAGWASLTPWSDRCAYADTAENSLYVRADLRGSGIGSRLLSALLEEARRGGLHTVLARVTQGNEGSIRLHEGFGFTVVGVMREVGRKFGQRLDVTLLQVLLDGGGPARGRMPGRP
jgi:L-amino acid N-acyltransferase YncA